MTTIVQSAMTAAVPVTDLSGVETQLAVQNLRSVINNNSAYIRAVDGIADEFADSTGVRDTAYSGDNILPIMTSNTAPAGVWSASSQLNSSFHAFNVSNNLEDYWQTSNGDVVNSWLKYDFGASNEKTIIKYVFKSSGDSSCAKDWTFEGSNNDSTWVVLHTVTDQVQGSTNDLTTYTFNNATAYRYYRLNFNLTVSSTAYLNCRGLTFHEAVAGVFVSTNTTYDATGDYYHAIPADEIGVISGTQAYSGALGFADMTFKVSNSSTVAALGVYNNQSAHTYTVKLVKRTSAGVFDVVASGPSDLVHTAGGWEYKTLTTPYVIPATGDYYIYAYAAGGGSYTVSKSDGSARAYSATEATGTSFSLAESAAWCFPCGARFSALDMTLISETFTAETAPSESSAVFLHQPLDSVTLNTDILGYISRDAGTTWTQGTIVDAGSFDSTINILTMNAVDISGQPSGTSMKYKIVTANAKEQRLHGAWLAWS